ncbi:MAG: maleylpyruvate isomerase N-terminal domain-containing protein, partial [Actinomycetota bacterium]|nr:maleylpyruvate isomerase N-terminal domain-containing protein [Actinomycetota bacterium]
PTQQRLLEAPVEIDFDGALRAFEVAARRFTDLVRSIPDPHRRTRGLDWSLADTAAHVLLAVRYDLGTLTGTRSPFPVENGDIFSAGTEHNAALLRAEPERDPGRLADGIDEVVREFIDEAQRRAPRDPAPMAGGHAITVADLAGVMVGEMIVHGYDIARTLGKSLTIDGDAARCAAYATLPLLPLAVDPDTTRSVNVGIEIRIRGGESFLVDIHDGTARARRPSGKADLYVSADPVAYLLVAYGRWGPWTPLLRGRMIAWGRRPAVALKLPTYFRNP